MKILYFAPLAFNDLKQRPQEIAEALSAKHEVWYVEPTISFIGALKNRSLHYRAEVHDLSPMLHVIRLDGRFALPIRLQFLDPLRLNTLSEKKQLSKLFKTCDVIWIGYEVWERLLPSSLTGILVYDKMDDNDQLSSDQRIRNFLIQGEKQLIEKSSLIFVTARQFLERFNTVPNVHLIPNGMRYQLPKGHNKVRKNRRKVFGYIGKISHWFDTDAIIKLAEANPDCDIVLVGPYDSLDILCSNVKYIGSVPKEEVPDWICSFDVCLYPFKQNELLDTINPVKIYEYLAYNKPVIAVNSKEMQAFKDLVYLYNNYDELISLSHSNLTLPFDGEVQREAFLNKNSWNCRVKQIEQIIEEVKESQNEKSHVSLRNSS